MALPQTRTFITSLLSSLTPAHPKDQESKNPLKSLSASQRNIVLTLHVLFPNELLPALDLLDRELVTRFKLRGEARETQPLSGSNRNTKSNPELEPVSGSRNTTQREQRTKEDLYPHTYHVRSAQQSSSSSSSSSGGGGAGSKSKRYRDPVASASHYQVHTSSWSCSCPAFAFAAFPAGNQGSGFSSASASAGRGYGVDGGEVTGGNPGEDGGREDGVDGDEDQKEEEEGDEWSVGGSSLGSGVPVCKHLLACTLVERTGLFAGCVQEKEVSLEEMAGWAAGWGA